VAHPEGGISLLLLGRWLLLRTSWEPSSRHFGE
jgi:hypothetical protein